MKPSDATLLTLARQIAENRAADNLQFWIVLGVLAIVIVAIVAMFRGYFTERGRLHAFAATVTGRLDELRLSTDATERIKIKIAHNDWTVKELKTLRRTKLEQLTLATFKLISNSQIDARIPKAGDGFDVLTAESMIEIEQISLLYFADFAAETVAISRAHNNFGKFLVHNRSRMLQQLAVIDKCEKDFDIEFAKTPTDREKCEATLQALKESRAALTIMQNEYVQAYAPVTIRLRNSVDVLQSRASALMAELIAPTV